MIALIQIGILFLLCAVAVNFLLNLFCIKALSPIRFESADRPLVSALVPARNEERNIKECVESLLAQDYDLMEILVLDDESEDDTAKIVEEIANRDARVKLLKGEPLPKGWIGKCWACRQLYEKAQGEWLLFTDADARLSRSALSTSLAYAMETRADLLSMLPKQEAEGIGVRIVLPLLYFTLYTLLPGALMQRSSDPSISAAIGQFLLFRREAYEAIDGHRGASSSIVEDLYLARAIKKSGRRAVLADGAKLISCRMYGSFSELWSGFTKNFFASFSYSPIRLGVFIFLNAVLYISPFLYIAFSPLNGAMAAIQAFAPYFMRLALSRRHPAAAASILLHPLATAAMIAIACNSIYRILGKRGVDWKGRVYR